MLGLAGSALAVDQADLDARLRRFTAEIRDFQAKPDKAVPPELLRNAQGILLLDRTKAGFLFAFQGGSGVALAKDPTTKQWGAPAFFTANEASLGFQVGGENAFYVILFMNDNSVRALTAPTYSVGSEARGTAGDLYGGAQSEISNGQPNAIVFDDRRGLFGGADVKTGALSPDKEANLIYYSHPYSAADILFGHQAEPSDAGLDLARTLDELSRSPRVADNQR